MAQSEAGSTLLSQWSSRIRHILDTVPGSPLMDEQVTLTKEIASEGMLLLSVSRNTIREEVIRLHVHSPMFKKGRGWERRLVTDRYPKGVMVTPAVTTALRLLGGKRKYSWIVINKN